MCVSSFCLFPSFVRSRSKAKVAHFSLYCLPAIETYAQVGHRHTFYQNRTKLYLLSRKLPKLLLLLKLGVVSLYVCKRPSFLVHIRIPHISRAAFLLNTRTFFLVHVCFVYVCVCVRVCMSQKINIHDKQRLVTTSLTQSGL